LNQFQTRLARDDDQTEWDTYVRSHENAGPYHLFAWKRAVEHAYGHTCFYIISEYENGKVVGILPLVLVKPPLLPGTIVSLPFCDYGGVLSTETAAMEAMYNHAMQIAEVAGARMDIRCRRTEPVLTDTHGLVEISHKVRMILDLPENSELLWNSFKSKLRSQIRKPQKDGLTFTLGSIELLHDFYAVFRLNMRNLGSPVHARNWIESVIRFFHEDAHVGVVYWGGTAVAAGIILACRDTISIPWASALSEYSRSSPNMLLYWGFLSYACNNGFRRFDFGRSTPDEGTYRFKEQWGARPVPLYWYGAGNAGLKVSTPGGGSIRKNVEAIWSRLPQGLVDRMGPILRKYITL